MSVLTVDEGHNFMKVRDIGEDKEETESREEPKTGDEPEYEEGDESRCAVMRNIEEANVTVVSLPTCTAPIVINTPYNKAPTLTSDDHIVIIENGEEDALCRDLLKTSLPLFEI